MSGFGNIHKLIPDLKKLVRRVLIGVLTVAAIYGYMRYYK